ncbi:MAG: hypothetical protein HQL38_05600 [Alphaproteobacteria bacterium]|nr:hypothetical protein [Alphaproteobacteria bacterium]
MPLSDTKFNQRITLLQTSAEEVATLLTKRLTERLGPLPPGVIPVRPTPRHEVFSDIVSRYSAELDCFKASHFVDDRRANNSKIAGLLIRVLIGRGVEDLFVPHPRLARFGLEVEAGIYFVWHLTCAILVIEQRRLEPGFKRDFLGAVASCDEMPREVACFATAALRKAFGDPRVDLDDGQ